MLMSAAFIFSALLQFALSLMVAAILGPDEFGLYALVLAAAVLTQTFALEWLRLCAARFHHPGAPPALARRLWRFTLLIGLGLLAAGASVAALLAQHRWHYLLVAALALINAAADLNLAMARAAFETRRFALTLSLRAVLAILLVPWAAHALGTALAALAALGVATLLPALAALRRGAPDGVGEAPTTRVLLGYAGPIVLTNAIYQGLFLALRLGVAAFGGLAAAGQFSLALEFVLKLFTTVGTALDIALFPLALRAEREGGGSASARTGANLALVAAILAPMALGLALVAPGLEPLLVAAAFRGSFAAFVTTLTPGIALYALVQYGLHPFAQLRHRTRDLLAAALLAALLGAGAGLILHKGGLSPERIGAALAMAMAGATAFLARRAGKSALPSRRFLLSLLCCLAALGVSLTPFIALGLTLPRLIGAIPLGVLTYAGSAFLLDLAGLRTLVKQRA